MPNLTFNIADLVGVDFDPRRTKVWIEANADPIIDTAGHVIHFGDAKADVGNDGTGTFTGLLATNATGVNPTGFLYRAWVDYAPRSAPTRKQWNSGWFALTADSDLSLVVPVTPTPPNVTTDTATAADINNPASATAAALSASIDARAAHKQVRVSDLTYPIFIAHRGLSNLLPESTIESYSAAATNRYITVTEGGDIQATSDGGLIDMHDTTVDRTTTGSGNVSAFNTAGIMRLTVDSSSWFSNTWGDSKVTTFANILGSLGGTTILVPEVKDQLDSTASAMFKAIKAAGLQDSVIVASFITSNLQVPEGAGFAKMVTIGAIPPDPAGSIAEWIASGINFLAIDYAATGDLAGFVTSLHAAGMKAICYGIEHQTDWDAAAAKGFDGCFSNDPLYVSRNYAAYRKTSTAWHLNGTWGNGMMRSGSGPFPTSNRGTFVGVPGAYRWAALANAVVGPGPVCPVASPSGTYTLTFKFVVDSVPSTNTQGACFFVAAPDDLCTNVGGNVPNSYLFKFRGSGTVSSWIIDGAGTAAAQGTLTTTAWSIPTLSAGLTSGAAVTSLPVNALTVAIKSGHQFMLPTGQIATASGAAAVGATAIPVSSITPSAAVTTGSGLLPYITATITVSPTNVTCVRTDESAVGTITITDTSKRGAYASIMNAINAGAGAVSFHSVTVS